MFWQICWLCRERWSFRGREGEWETERERGEKQRVSDGEGGSKTHPPTSHLCSYTCTQCSQRMSGVWFPALPLLSSPLHTRPTHTFIFSVFFTSCPAVQTVSKPANFIHAVSTSPKEGVGDNTRHSRLVDTATAASDYNPTTVSVSLNLKRKWLTVCRTEI